MKQEKERQEAIEQQAAAPVNTIKLKFPLVNAVTRSQGEAPANQTPPVEEDPLDWITLDATTRDTVKGIQEHQSSKRFCVPTKLMGMNPNEDGKFNKFGLRSSTRMSGWRMNSVSTREMFPDHETC